ncbi:MAG TPA: hypothetical protein VGV17_04175 [Bosea sp. (in: a-proteobacteria)]|jgi:hypothetical protein|uniref:hypothetical protein n=1 Tax=Bosea sp. (in: a-proteobacteria) TaxID=1871050 RepID=UPI002DDD58C3|nr:hypothetical protein [Bosea sp. (in: a-proteobacteria)]HEV2552944.1 hypothetical protein [Bosea sp. (in: a-proteobacteria)]
MQPNRDINAPMFLAGAIALAFLPAVLFPHYLADDLWIFRPQTEGFPDVWFIAINQGRPIFAGLIQFSKSLHELIGIYAVSATRAVAILFLILFGIAVFRILIDYKFERTNALVFSIVLCTLPGSQMYVVGGPWLSIGWATSAWCARWILAPGNNPCLSRNFILSCLCLFFNILLCLFLYQAIPFAIVALMIIPVLFSSRPIRSIVFTPLVVFLISIAVYVIIWFYITSSFDAGQDKRYSIQNLNVSFTEQYHLLKLRAELFFNKRMPMVLAVWDVRDGFVFTQIVTATVIVAGFVFDLARQNALPQRLVTLLRWAIALSLFVLSDFAAIAAKPGTLVFSYMTVGAPMLAVTIILVYSVSCIGNALISAPHRRIIWRNYAFFVVPLILSVALYTVTAFYVFPAWLEQSLVRAHLRDHIQRAGKVDNVVAYTRSTRTMSNGARGEFSWSNLSYSFYLHWLIRMCLDQLKQDSDIKIDVNSTDGKVYTYPKFKLEPTDQGRVLLDLRPASLDRNAPIEKPLFEINRDRLPVGNGDRPPHAPDVISRWNRIPTGETPVPFQVRQSSFHYQGQGAIGEKGLNDGDVAAPAADAGGVNIGTEIVMEVPDNTLINRIRIIRDSKWGSDYSLSMKIQVSNDMEAWIDVGKIDLRGSISSLAESELSYDKPYKYIRLSYFSGIPGENIWISEISLFQKMGRPN